MVRVCSASVRRRRQTEGDRSSPPPADEGRQEWRWMQFAAPASLHLSGAQATSPSPSSSCTRSSGDGGGGCLSVVVRQGRGVARLHFLPALQIQVVSFLKAAKSPLVTALLPSGAPALCRRIQRLPLLPLLSTNSLNCNLIMSHECFDRRCRQTIA
jgi:hypothetical protein